jgi:hypothetical protein
MNRFFQSLAVVWSRFLVVPKDTTIKEAALGIISEIPSNFWSLRNFIKTFW